MNIYLVGGAVRDELLGLKVKDRDWVVVGATSQLLIDKGFLAIGKDFPVFLHPDTKEEYALARTERKTGRGYHGFKFDTNKNVSLEDDLLRRDITINAIAKDENGRLIDPFNGVNDINNKIIRHVSEAFCEDPVRILRVARFSARYKRLGFGVADETMSLMRDMVLDGEVDALVSERVWQETHSALAEETPVTYFKILRNCYALNVLFPEIDALFGIPQGTKYHAEIDCGRHTMMVLEEACNLSDIPEIRFAALVHDLGKGVSDPGNWPSHKQHEKNGLSLIRILCQRLRVPKTYLRLALRVCEYHLYVHRAKHLKPQTLLKLILATDALRQPKEFDYFLAVCKADSLGRFPPAMQSIDNLDFLKYIRDAVSKVDIKPLIDNGICGDELIEGIHQRRLSTIKSAIKSYSKRNTI